MTKYRFLALDLDGTLLNEQKEISSLTKSTLKEVEKLGIQVIFTTGRGIQRVEHLRNELNLNSPMVLLNGAEIWINSSYNLERHFISKEDISYLYSLAVDSQSNFWGYNVKHHIGWENWNEDMLDEDWMKFGMSHNDRDVIKQLRNDLMSSPSIGITNSAANNIECSVKGVSKQYGIKKLCDYYKVNLEEVIAIGDNMNDYGLIKTAGLGVAMENSCDELKAIADDMTVSNDNDGVARAVEKHILTNSII